MALRANGMELGLASSVATTDAILRALAAARTREELARLMDAITRELGFRHYALIHHADLRGDPAGRVRLTDYPAIIEARLIDEGMWRRDPVIRGCIYARQAFCWSDLPVMMELNRGDRESFAQGAKFGLQEGITVPCLALGEPTGSCTFAGSIAPERAAHRLGMAHLIGIFAFQAARRVLNASAQPPTPRNRLHPRPRDCVVLAGRGFSNKEIARALHLTPRTVDGYLREARNLFDAHDRTELVVSALLAGEVGLDEVQRSQPA